MTAYLAAARFGPTTFTLTVDQDPITFGQWTNPVKGQAIFNAPLSGIFGNQATLTSGDSIVDTGPGSAASVLNATFNGSATASGVNLQGVPIWNFQNVSTGSGHTVTISGGLGNTISGLMNLTYNDNGGGNSLAIGTTLSPIQLAAGAVAGEYSGLTVTVANALGGGSGTGHNVDLLFAANALTGTDTINVNAEIVGNHSDYDLDDAYGIAAGAPGGGATKPVGFGSWVLSSTGAAVGTVNDIALGGFGATAKTASATSLTITDDGFTTIVYASKASGAGSCGMAESGDHRCVGNHLSVHDHRRRDKFRQPWWRLACE